MDHSSGGGSNRFVFRACCWYKQANLVHCVMTRLHTCTISRTMAPTKIIPPYFCPCLVLHKKLFLQSTKYLHRQTSVHSGYHLIITIFVLVPL